MLAISEKCKTARSTFFQGIFEGVEGWICIAKRLKGHPVIAEQYFQFPSQLENLLEYIEANAMEHHVWFCPNILSYPKRNKEQVLSCPTLWADLDGCPPSKIPQGLRPTIVMQTSVNRFQALWKLKKSANPYEAEDVCKRIAYFHAHDGADTSGWDLSQLLRVPYTYNFKDEYATLSGYPLVEIYDANNDTYTLDQFREKYPEVETSKTLDLPFPDIIEPSQDVLHRRRHDIPDLAWHNIRNAPANKSDWSRSLWNLEMALIEAGLSREETFTICRDAACNKYRRDGRPDIDLWREVCKAHNEVTSRDSTLKLVSDIEFLPPILTEAEKSLADSTTTIIEEYVKWASSETDAPTQYHELGAFMVLSCLLCGSVEFQWASDEVIAPNIWGVILAGTTLTRKSTALNKAMRIITEIDEEAILATDGTIEGLYEGLSTRPGRASLFIRDEFGGFIKEMHGKHYMTGMEEGLNQLYDGRLVKRMLRKGTQYIRKPRLVLFSAGIKKSVIQELTFSSVENGFLPRFIIVSGETTKASRKPLQASVFALETERQKIIDKYRRIYDTYNVETIPLGSPKARKARMTEEAWTRYAEIHTMMEDVGDTSSMSDILTPCLSRMTISGLKMSVLLAAARQEYLDEVTIELRDVLKAFSFVQKWLPYTIEILRGIGVSPAEKNVEHIAELIKRHPNISKAEIGRITKLDAKTLDMAISTLDQRMNILRRPGAQKRSERYEWRD